jgi:hypothetical protein
VPELLADLTFRAGEGVEVLILFYAPEVNVFVASWKRLHPELNPCPSLVAGEENVIGDADR